MSVEVAPNSTYTEKLLGLHINSDFEWSTKVSKICNELKKKTGLLRIISGRVLKEKIIMIDDAIFKSLIRYGAALYLTPTY